MVQATLETRLCGCCYFFAIHTIVIGQILQIDTATFTKLVLLNPNYFNGLGYRQYQMMNGKKELHPYIDRTMLKIPK